MLSYNIPHASQQHLLRGQSSSVADGEATNDHFPGTSFYFLSEGAILSISVVPLTTFPTPFLATPSPPRLRGEGRTPHNPPHQSAPFPLPTFFFFSLSSSDVFAGVS